MTRSRSLALTAMAVFSCALALTTTNAEAAGKAKGPVKVFMLSGQSNMEDEASVSTLDAVINDPKTREQYEHLKPDGKWLVREDVWVTYMDRKSRSGPAPLHGPLSVGFGSPE